MNEITYTEEELAEAIKIIKPELPEYDEKDHELAKLRFVIHEMNEELTEIWHLTSKWAQDNMGTSWFDRMHRRMYNWWWKFTGKRRWRFMPAQPLRTMEEVHDLLDRILWIDGNCRLPDGTEQDVIDKYADDNYWEYKKNDHVNGIHCGDCTATAATCGKCHAEQFYLFQSPWKDKISGSRALSIFLDNKRKLKAAEKEKMS